MTDHKTHDIEEFLASVKRVLRLYDHLIAQHDHKVIIDDSFLFDFVQIAFSKTWIQQVSTYLGIPADPKIQELMKKPSLANIKELKGINRAAGPLIALMSKITT